jgi:hypothetical protein
LIFFDLVLALFLAFRKELGQDLLDEFCRGNTTAIMMAAMMITTATVRIVLTMTTGGNDNGRVDGNKFDYNDGRWGL